MYICNKNSEVKRRTQVVNKNKKKKKPEKSTNIPTKVISAGLRTSSFFSQFSFKFK